MTVVALGALKASPGVTTTAVALAAAWPPPRTAVLVEADPDGGVLAPRYGLAADPGLASLSAAVRRQADLTDLTAHTQTAVGGLDVVPAPSSAEHARAALEGARNLARALASVGTVDVVVDCGRVGPGSPSLALFRAADRAALVCRPRLDELHHVVPYARGAAAELALELILIGGHPYPGPEVAAATGIPVLDTLPDDAAAASALRDGRGHPNAVRRSALYRQVGALAEALAGSGDDPVEPSAAREQAEAV